MIKSLVVAKSIVMGTSFVSSARNLGTYKSGVVRQGNSQVFKGAINSASKFLGLKGATQLIGYENEGKLALDVRLVWGLI